MAVHGYSRSTKALDVFMLDENRGQVLRAMREQGLTVMPVFAPSHYIAYLPQHNDQETRVNLIFPVTEPELSAIEHPMKGNVGGFPMNIFPINLLVMSKAYSDRPEDVQDIAAMLNRGMFDPAEVHRVIESIDHDGAEDFDALIEELMKRRKVRKKPVRK